MDSWFFLSFVPARVDFVGCGSGTGEELSALKSFESFLPVQIDARKQLS
jgi:hypothetical protein